MCEKLSCSGRLDKIYWILIKCRCSGLVLPEAESKAEHSRENGNVPVAAALLCVGSEAVPWHTDNTASGDWGGEISQPMAELWQQLRLEYSFSIEFSWHAASNVFSPRNQNGFNIFQSEKKKRHYHAIPLLYWLMERKNNFF